VQPIAKQDSNLLTIPSAADRASAARAAAGSGAWAETK